MTSETKPMTDAWLRRALTVALGFAYTPAFVASPLALKDALRALLAQEKLWGLGLGVVASCVAVVLAFLALTLFRRPLAERTRKKLFLFLLAYWFPHTALVAYWGFLGAVAAPGAWID